MGRNSIGLEIGAHSAKMTVVTFESARTGRIRHFESRGEDLAEQLVDLKRQYGEEFRHGDQITALLPSAGAFVRELEFPFSQRKNIAAVVDLALDTRIPAAVDDCATAFYTFNGTAETTHAMAAAVPDSAVRNLLEAAEAAGFPIHIIDLAPHAFVAGLEGILQDGLLLTVNETEATLAQVRDGQLAGYRLIGGWQALDDAGKAACLSREIRALGSVDRDCCCLGAVEIDALAPLFEGCGPRLSMFELRLFNNPIAEPFVTATVLALRSRASQKAQSFNFRTGKYPFRGEWQRLKGPMSLSCLLSLALLVMLAGTAVVKNRHVRDRVQALDREMTEIYRGAFPETTNIVDVPLQMQSKLQELEKRQALIGHGYAGALEVWSALARLPDNVRLEIQELKYSPPEFSFEGTAGSFEEINRIKDRLEGDPMFASVQVANANVVLKGQQINFRLQTVLADGRGAL